jgi:hypothetical protein
MAKTSANIAFVAGTVLCIIFLIGIGSGPTTTALAQGRNQPAEQVQDPYQDSRILIEAFVVEVNLDALYKAGVSPIASKPNAISIDNILHCLKDPDSANVASGAKVAVRHKQHNSIQQRTTKMVKRTTTNMAKQTGRKPVPTRSHRFDDYSAGLAFNVNARVQSEQTVAVEFEFSQTDFVFSEPNTPPDTINRDFSGRVSLELGKPSIVGSTQNAEQAAILILTADIKNQ